MLSFYLSLLESEEDKSKFTKLYNRYVKLMLWVAKDILEDEQQIEDAVHTSFLKVIRNFHKVGEVNSHKTRRYLVVITRNTAIDMWRKNKREENNQSYDEMEAFLPSRERETMTGRMEAQELSRLLEELPDIYRDVLELHVYHGMTEKQIAAVLDVKYATVRKRLERARAMLAEKIRQQEGETV